MRNALQKIIVMKFVSQVTNDCFDERRWMQNDCAAAVEMKETKAKAYCFDGPAGERTNQRKSVFAVYKC